MSKIDIDLKDRKILYELDCSSRQPLSRIAKKVRLSKEVVNYRINRMIEKGIIRAFYARVDTSKQGLLAFRTFLRLQNVSPKREKQIINFLISQKQIGWAVSIQGAWDINFIYWARDNNEFFNFWKLFKRRYGSNIENRWTALYGWFMNFPKCYLIGKPFEGKPFRCGLSKKVDLDDLDVRILDILATRAREPLLNIADELGVSDKVVSYRIKKMEQLGVIGGYGVQLDLDKIGYEYWKIHFQFHNYNEERFNEFNNYCIAHSNIIYTNELIGGADFEIEGHFTGHKELQKVLGEIRYKFADIIRDFETMLYYKEHMLVLFPS